MGRPLICFSSGSSFHAHSPVLSVKKRAKRAFLSPALLFHHSDQLVKPPVQLLHLAEGMILGQDISLDLALRDTVGSVYTLREGA